MRGTPIVRLLLLALFLSGATFLVAKLATSSPLGTSPPPPDQGLTASTEVPTYLEATLSAPANSVVFKRKGSQPTLAHEPTELTFEEEIRLELGDSGGTRDDVTVLWHNTAQSNFLLLILEPEGLETKTITLHFPPQVITVPLDLHWPEAHPSH